jgi:hypothetical protein
MSTSTQKLTDLCCCVNAFEGYDIAYPTQKPYMKAYQRQRKVLVDCVMGEAESLYAYGVTLRRLSNALKKGGWDDNYFVRENGKLVIKDINGRS